MSKVGHCIRGISVLHNYPSDYNWSLKLGICVCGMFCVAGYCIFLFGNNNNNNDDDDNDNNNHYYKKNNNTTIALFL